MSNINIGDSVEINDKIMYGHGLPCKVADTRGSGDSLEYLIEVDGGLRLWFYRYQIDKQPAPVASEPDSALTPDVTTVEPPSNMFIRDVDEPYYQHREIYPFLPPVVSPYELAHGGYLYVDKETSELCFNMQLRRLDPNDTRKLIAALEYALSTITD